MFSLPSVGRPGPLRSALPLIAAALGAVVLASRDEPPQEHAALRLDEADRIAIPAIGPIRAVATATDGQIAVLGRDCVLVVDPPRGTASCRPFAGPPVGIHLGENGRLTLLDGTGSTVQPPDAPSEGRSPGPPHPFRIDQAVHVGDAWIVGGHDAGGIYRLHRIRTSGDAFPITLPPSLPPASPLPPRLGIVARGLSITAAAPPYTTAILSLDGRVAAILRPNRPWFSEKPGEPAQWTAQPPVDLLDGYVQTFADLASNRRIFVRYDRAGREIRRRTLDVPLALLARTADGHLVGVRQMKGKELVFFRESSESPEPGEA